MKMTFQSYYRAAAFVLATFAGASFAMADGIDVLVAQPGSGTTTVVGQVDKGVPDGDVDLSVRVFESLMIVEEENPGEFVWESEEPGFFTGSVDTTPDLSGTDAVAAADGLTISVFESPFAIDGEISDLFYWDGTGSPSFAPAVGASFALEPEGVLGGGAEVTGGLYDEHPDFLVETGGAAAPAGIYLASVVAELEGFDPSEPIFIVFATLDPTFLGLDPGETDEEVIEEAAEFFLDPAVGWVESNVIPEPSAALLALLAATGAVATRKRR